MTLSPQSTEHLLQDETLQKLKEEQDALVLITNVDFKNILTTIAREIFEQFPTTSKIVWLQHPVDSTLQFTVLTPEHTSLAASAVEGYLKTLDSNLMFLHFGNNPLKITIDSDFEITTNTA